MSIGIIPPISTAKWRWEFLSRIERRRPINSNTAPPLWSGTPRNDKSQNNTCVIVPLCWPSAMDRERRFELTLSNHFLPPILPLSLSLIHSLIPSPPLPLSPSIPPSLCLSPSLSHGVLVLVSVDHYQTVTVSIYPIWRVLLLYSIITKKINNFIIKFK